MKKAQVAFEFVLIVAIVFLLLVIFTYVVLENTESLSSENEYNYLIDMARAVQTELYLAAAVGDGYQRTLDLPELLNGMYNYTVGVSNNTLVSESENYQYVLSVPEISGDIKKGNNTINKTGEVIIVTND